VSWGYDPPAVVVPLLQPCWNPGLEKKTMHGAFREGGRAQRHEMGGYCIRLVIHAETRHVTHTVLQCGG
jgi:hypothetical protein